jgi:uncharacterized protein YxjI
MHSSFQYDRYLLKRQVLALTGKFRIYTDGGQLVLYSQQKMFKLKEDIRVYVDEDMSQELLYIQARQIIDFSAAYDVWDSTSGSRVGILKRKGLRSMMRDEWIVLDSDESLFGVLIEDSLGQAMLRRLVLGSLLPQNYDLLVNQERVADFRQRFNLLRYELEIDISRGSNVQVDPRLGIAAAILLATIEGRQD